MVLPKRGRGNDLQEWYGDKGRHCLSGRTCYPELKTWFAHDRKRKARPLNRFDAVAVGMPDPWVKR